MRWNTKTKINLGQETSTKMNRQKEGQTDNDTQTASRWSWRLMLRQRERYVTKHHGLKSKIKHANITENTVLIIISQIPKLSRDTCKNDRKPQVAPDYLKNSWIRQEGADTSNFWVYDHDYSKSSYSHNGFATNNYLTTVQNQLFQSFPQRSVPIQPH